MNVKVAPLLKHATTQYLPSVWAYQGGYEFKLNTDLDSTMHVAANWLFSRNKSQPVWTTRELTVFIDQAEEEGHIGVSASSHRARKSNSFDTGTGGMHAHCSTFPKNHNLWCHTWCEPKPVELHGCFIEWAPVPTHPPTLCPSHRFPQAWTRASLLIWTGLQIAECLWTNPVSPSTETDLWTALLGPDVCICFTSRERAVLLSL